MKFYENQLNLGNIFEECSTLFEEHNPKLLALLNNYLDINQYISYEFKNAFYSDTGRPREYSLHSFLSALILQKIFNIPTDTLLIIILNLSLEMRDFCGFIKVPDASKFTRFKQKFYPFLEKLFSELVEITEPICQQINSELANAISLDTSAVEVFVEENNPKYINNSIKRLKSYYKFKNETKSNEDIYKQAYSSMPKSASSDSTIKKMYANGHFCYGRKFGIITNGLGIPRHIQFFDDEFKSKHSDFIFEDTDSPNYDKSVADSKALIPMLSDFYSLHPNFSHHDFLGDAAFDVNEIYQFLLAKNTNNTSLFKRAFIPLNSRAKTSKPDCPINDNGIPLCPKNNSLEMKPNGYSHKRGCYIWVCPKRNANRICSCENPCTNSKYGRVCNVYPAKNLRLYPGTIRGTDEWFKMYKIRGVVEQAINHIKSNMGIAGRKTRNAKTIKADVFLAGIAQLFTVIVANNMSKPQYIRSLKKLAC